MFGWGQEWAILDNLKQVFLSVARSAIFEQLLPLFLPCFSKQFIRNYLINNSQMFQYQHLTIGIVALSICSWLHDCMCIQFSMVFLFIGYAPKQFTCVTYEIVFYVFSRWLGIATKSLLKKLVGFFLFYTLQTSTITWFMKLFLESPNTIFSCQLSVFSSIVIYSELVTMLMVIFIVQFTLFYRRSWMTL